MSIMLTIPKYMTHGDELVVVRRNEYDDLRRQFVELKDALAKIRRGESELKNGRTRIVKSLSQLRA